eukprot:818492-Pleurochrysis_carterae.AAC.1
MQSRVLLQYTLDDSLQRSEKRRGERQGMLTRAMLKTVGVGRVQGPLKSGSKVPKTLQQG